MGRVYVVKRNEQGEAFPAEAKMQLLADFDDMCDFTVEVERFGYYTFFDLWAYAPIATSESAVPRQTSDHSEREPVSESCDVLVQVIDLTLEDSDQLTVRVRRLDESSA